jgi:hypothetical protein
VALGGEPLQGIHFNTSAARGGRGSRIERAPRDLAVALASAGVVALLVFYAVAAPTASLTASIGPIVPRQGSSPLVLGRVLDSGGGGLKGARIKVARVSSDRAVAFGTTDASGSFRVELPSRCGDYAISVEARAEGSTVRKRDHRHLCPGDALPVDARVKTQGHFLWVPGPR